MKIVVTGGLGHIGSRLIRELPEAFPSAEIHNIDNLLTQRYPALFNLPANGKYRFYEEDIFKADLTSIFTGAAAVVHLAAITDAASSFGNAGEVERVNFEGTALVAQACAAVNVPLIFLSTTSVYGTQQQVVDESCSKDELKPQSPYAQAKIKAEECLTDLGQSRDLAFVILRFGTIFGASPGMRFHTAVNKFIWQAVQCKPITVWRTAYDQKRPYLDLTDGVRALCFVIKKKLFDRQIYNVLTINASVREIVEAIRSAAGELSIEYVDSQIMNQLSYNVANEKFSRLGFHFEGNLYKSIAESVALLKAANNLSV